eukprot:COSAG06_NODE_474_length_15284_cov_124.295582_11_plen_104_part_00
MPTHSAAAASSSRSSRKRRSPPAATAENPAKRRGAKRARRQWPIHPLSCRRHEQRKPREHAYERRASRAACLSCGLCAQLTWASRYLCTMRAGELGWRNIWGR